MRKCFLWAVAAAVAVGLLDPVAARAEAKPVVKVSIAGCDELLEDVNFLGVLAGKPDLRRQLEGELKSLTGGKGLAGVDKSKPWGMVVENAGSMMDWKIMVFLPVTNLDRLVEAAEAISRTRPEARPLIAGLKELAGKSKTDPDAVAEVSMPGGTAYLRYDSRRGWLYAAQATSFLSPAAHPLKTVPADPVKLLGELPRKYDLAVQLDIGNLPQDLREMFITQMQLGAESGMEQGPGESDEEYAVRKQITEGMLEDMYRAIRELKDVTLGVDVDRQAGTASIELAMTAKPGTQTAKEFAELDEAKTDFAGFLIDDAALSANWSMELAESDIAQIKSLLAAARAGAEAEMEKESASEEELREGKQLFDDLMDLFEATIEGGRLDGGLAILLKPSALTVLGGGTIADGAKADSVIRKIRKMARRENPDIARAWKLNVDRHKGVRFHLLSIPTEEFDEAAEKMRELVGEKLDVVLGVGPKAVYVAAGRDALASLKEAIDRSAARPGAKVPPLTISLAAKPIAEFVAEVAEEAGVRQQAAQVAARLADAPGKDRLTLTVQSIPNGAAIRLQAEQGLIAAVLRLIPMPPIGGNLGPPQLQSSTGARFSLTSRRTSDGRIEPSYPGPSGTPP